LADDRQVRDVDRRHQAVSLGGHVHGLAVGSHGDPFGLLADAGHLAADHSGVEIERRHLGGLFVRHVEDLAIGRQVERLGVLAAPENAQKLTGAQIDDSHSVGAPVRGWKLGFVDARASAR